MHFSPQWGRLLPVLRRGSDVDDSLFVVAPIVCGVLCLILVLLFGTLFPSSFAIILIGKRELVALL